MHVDDIIQHADKFQVFFFITINADDLLDIISFTTAATILSSSLFAAASSASAAPPFHLLL